MINLNASSVKLSPNPLPSYSCKKLWLAVINQSIIDALSNNRHAKARNNKIRAIKWIISDNENFENICQLAGLSHQSTRRKIIKILSSDQAARKIMLALNCKLEPITPPKINIKKMLNTLRGISASALPTTYLMGTKTPSQHQAIASS